MLTPGPPGFSRSDLATAAKRSMRRNLKDINFSRYSVMDLEQNIHFIITNATR
jgi:hypothetical protein